MAMGQKNNVSDELAPEKDKKIMPAVIVSVLITTVVIGLSSYIWQISKDKTAQIKLGRLQSKVSVLENQLEVLQKERQKNNETCKESLDGPNSPEVTFATNDFSLEEKNGLLKKVIIPFADYMKESEPSENQPFGFLIKKVNDEKTKKLGYLYEINALQNGQGTNSWLQKEVRDYWIPDCMDKCKFSETYSQKYPEVIKRYFDAQKEIQ